MLLRIIVHFSIISLILLCIVSYYFQNKRIDVSDMCRIRYIYRICVS